MAKTSAGPRPVEWCCLRCKHEYHEDYDPDAPLVERQCPKCRSNSVRRQSHKGK